MNPKRPRPPAQEQDRLLPLTGEGVSADWVVDVATSNEKPYAWYANVYRNGFTHSRAWRPVNSQPELDAVTWSLGLLRDHPGSIAYRGLVHLSNPLKQLLASRNTNVLDRPSSKSVRGSLARSRKYLLAECDTSYRPPPLPPLEEDALTTAAFKTLDLDEETLHLYETASLTANETRPIVLEYVLQSFLGGYSPLIPYSSDRLKLLAVRRRQLERIASAYDFLTGAAAEAFYNAWTSILGDLPWPSPSPAGPITWELACP